MLYVPIGHPIPTEPQHHLPPSLPSHSCTTVTVLAHCPVPPHGPGIPLPIHIDGTRLQAIMCARRLDIIRIGSPLQLQGAVSAQPGPGDAARKRPLGAVGVADVAGVVGGADADAGQEVGVGELPTEGVRARVDGAGGAGARLGGGADGGGVGVLGGGEITSGG